MTDVVYRHKYNQIVTKQENLFTDEVHKTEVVTVLTEKKDLDKTPEQTEDSEA